MTRSANRSRTPRRYPLTGLFPLALLFHPGRRPRAADWRWLSNLPAKSARNQIHIYIRGSSYLFSFIHLPRSSEMTHIIAKPEDLHIYPISPPTRNVVSLDAVHYNAIVRPIFAHPLACIHIRPSTLCYAYHHYQYSRRQYVRPSCCPSPRDTSVHSRPSLHLSVWTQLTLQSRLLRIDTLDTVDDACMGGHCDSRTHHWSGC